MQNVGGGGSTQFSPYSKKAESIKQELSKAYETNTHKRPSDHSPKHRQQQIQLSSQQYKQTEEQHPKKMEEKPKEQSPKTGEQSPKKTEQQQPPMISIKLPSSPSNSSPKKNQGGKIAAVDVSAVAQTGMRYLFDFL